MAEPQPRQPLMSLGAALRQMPLESPRRSAWPPLATRLTPPAPRWRWPLALAASLLALALLPSGRPTSEADRARTVAGTVAGSVATQRVDLAALMSESARLERLWAAASDNGASSATAAALSVELEDSLHMLDIQLEANREPAQQLTLWQRRVQLLRSVAAVETSRRYLAAEGRSLDVALVSAY